MKEQIKQLREALAKTTKSSNERWETDGPCVLYGTGKSGDGGDKYYGEIWTEVGRMEKSADANFVKIAHNILPDLLTYIEKLTQEAEAGRELKYVMKRISSNYCASGCGCEDYPNDTPGHEGLCVWKAYTREEIEEMCWFALNEYEKHLSE